MMNNKEHLTTGCSMLRNQPMVGSTGLNKIISIKASLNKGLSSLLIEDFPVSL